MAGHSVEAVEVFKGVLRDMLDRARTAKHVDTIEPAVAKSDFTDLLQRIDSSDHLVRSTETKRSSRFAVIETAVRDIFNVLLVSEFTSRRTNESN
jgi:THO complex subunit 1